MVREMGGHGFVAYTVVGDTVNTGSRLEGQAPVGGVLIGEGTRRLLPDGTVAEAVPRVRVKGKATPLEAYVLHALPGREEPAASV
jgi:adenylate cyclase